MIEVTDLTKVYPGVVAVDRISFSVEKGEIVGFLGPNGAGKSTTMRILTCFIPPSSGSCRVAGFDVVRDSLKVRRRVGYLPENNPLYTEMRVEEYLHFRARIKGTSRNDRARAVGQALEKCAVWDVRSRIIGHLSKGYRQRVGLADAIVNSPEVLILDEPTIGLDPNQVREMRDLIRELGRERTVMLSTHILPEVEKVCGRTIIIHRGRIAAIGAPDEIVKKVLVTGRVRLEVRSTDGVEVKDRIQKIEHVARVFWTSNGDLQSYVLETRDHADIREEVFRMASENRWNLRELAWERLSLEDAFAELTETK